MFDSFIKTYADRAYRYPAMVSHQGSVIAFSMADQRRIFYTVLDLTATAADDADRWLAAPQELAFPTELAQVGLAVLDQWELDVFQAGSAVPVPAGTQLSATQVDEVLSTTARFTADAPFQAISDGTYVYVFRQSITPQSDPALMVYKAPDGTLAYTPGGSNVPLVNGMLLIDRFVLVGTELQSTREVRYQRSRSKTRPQSNKDSLGASDLEGRPFVEPTQALSFISGIRAGGFSVVLVPTQVAEIFRWQIFVATSASPLIDAYGIDRSSDGLFDLLGGAAADAAAPPCFAGAALSFAADGDHLTTSGPSLGRNFTVEMWLKPAAVATAGEMALFGADASTGSPGQAGPSAWITQGTRLRVGFGDGTAWHESVTADLLTPGAWNHVAICFDGAFVRVYVDGILRHLDGALKGIVPAATGLTRVGATAASFRGVLDEVRLWNVVRGAADISESMGRRLTGLEPGLAAYWRLDEAHGATAWDGASATPQVDATIAGPTWVASDAPIADTVSFTRTSLLIDQRTVTSGLSALLYFQQEPAPSGYDGTVKPLKSAARVMLAMATGGGQADGEIAVLDFAVGLDGRLAQVPTDLVLAPLDTSGLPSGPSDGMLARRRDLEAQIAALEPQIAAAQSAATQVGIIQAVIGNPWAFRLPAVSSLPVTLHALLQQYVSAPAAPAGPKAAALRALFDAEQPLRTAAAALGGLQQQLAPLPAELSLLETEIGGGASLRMPVIHVDPSGLTLAGGVLGYAATLATPLLFDSALGRVSLYFEGQDSQFLVTHYDTFTDRARLTQPADTGLVSFYSRAANLTDTAADATQALTVQVDAAADARFGTVTVTLASSTGTVTETWRNVPRQVDALASVLTGAAAAPYFAGFAGPASGTLTSLPFPGGLKASVAAGAVLTVEGQTLRVQADGAAGATTVAVEPVLATVSAGAAVLAAGYDYATDATTTQVAANLATGSNLVVVSADGAVGQLQGGTATYVSPSAACRWYAPPPGGALQLDGKTGLVKPQGTDLSGFTTGGDLTVESWVKPTAAMTGPARVVACQAPGGHSYTVALRRAQALKFNGSGDAVMIPPSLALQFTGPLTLEAWVQVQATDGLRAIVEHGYRLESPPGEVYLRISDGVYQVGRWNGPDTDAAATLPVPPGDVGPGTWVHLAGVFDGSAWHLYRNGTLAASAPDTTGPVNVQANWAIGASSAGDRFFAGVIDEVRIWNIARSASDIAAGLTQPVTGHEPGLAGFWRPGLPGNFHYSDQPPATQAQVQGSPTPVPGPFPSFTALFGVDSQLVASADVYAMPADAWSHIAAVFHQAYGVQVNATAGTAAYLDCGNDESLDLVGDLTIEVGARLDDLASPQALVGRGASSSDDPGMPYSLAVDTSGRLMFGFTDSSGQSYSISSTGTVSAGTFHRLAVTRSRSTTVNTNDPDPATMVTTSTAIAFFIDSRPAGGQSFPSPDPQSSAAPTRIGQALVGTDPASVQAGLRGTLSEVRIWSTARAQADIGAAIAGTENGLVSWWRFTENAGSTTADAKSNNTATMYGSVRWTTTPDPDGSQLVVCQDGVPVSTTPQPAGTFGAQFTLGALEQATSGEFLQGELTEVRVWRTARTVAELQDNLFSRLSGEFEDLLAYYRFDIGDDTVVSDSGPRGQDLVAGPGCVPVVSTAPLGDDIPQVRDALTGVVTPFNDTLAATPSVAEYAELETDANGNPTGELKRCYGTTRDGQWQLVTGFKVGDARAEWVGQAQFDPQLMGFIEGAPPVPSENLTVADSYDDASSVTFTEAQSTTYTYASSTDRGFDMSVQTSLSIGGKTAVETGIAYYSQILFESNLVGVTATFDTSLGWQSQAQNGVGNTTTWISSLALRGTKETVPAHKAVGARYVPDNTGLALVQSQTADVFALRLVSNGALVSYAMRANPDIPPDWNILIFPIDAQYTKQGTLDGMVGLEADADYPDALSGGSDQSYFKPVEAYALKIQIVQDEQRLSALYDQYDAATAGQAGTSLAGNPALPQPQKRNLCNTYVWTAAGGQFAEEEQTLDTVSETTGGSYSFQEMAGLTASLKFAVVGVAMDFELSALSGGHYNLSVTKSAGSQNSFGVQSVARPEAQISKPDVDGRLVPQPGKVDAYRYMTFYLEPSSDHYDAFFGQVVDPIWLQQSSDPAAAALRHVVQPGKRPACWRVLHRVTYVSRVLAPVPATPAQAPSLEQTMQQLDLSSNYELISVLGPFVRYKTSSYADFVTAVQAAVQTYLPQLQPHLDAVVSFLALYYGVTDSPQLTAAPEELAPAPPAVYAGAPQSVTLPSRAQLHGSALDDSADGATLTVVRTDVAGPATVVFSAPAALDTQATFTQPGIYVLRLEAKNGQLSAHSDTTVTVSAPAPQQATPQPPAHATA